MARPQEKMPVYDDKVNMVLRGLTKGTTREELAEELGYSSWKSLDVYMRRKNFTWDGKRQNYVPATTRADALLENVDVSAPPKVALVISLFSKESSDPRAVARQVGFSDHRELAEYMKSKGWVWSPDEGNYVQFRGELEASEKDAAELAENGDLQSNLLQFPADRKPLSGDFPQLQRFLPLLELLDRNKDRLLDLLTPASASGALPRYAVPGTPRTKSIYMSDLLARLVAEFGEGKNVSQREIVEAALIEYLKRYGFEREVGALLKKV